MSVIRFLCIADEYPWPANNGLRIRLANVLEGLAAAGEVDFFCTVSDRPDLHGITPESPVRHRGRIHHRGPYQPSLRGVPHWLRSGLPRSVAWREWDDPRAALHEWAEPPYDLVWYCHGHPWLGLGDHDLGPQLIDLLDLEDEKIRSMLRLGNGIDLGPATPNAVRGLLARRMLQIDARRWTRAHRKMRGSAARMVVCSELDRDRLGATSAAVVPNGFSASTRSDVPPRDPVMTMVGLQTYEPNIDGAHFFAKRVLPHVREQVPAARFAIVGRQAGALDDLVGRDGVDVRGEVNDLDGVFATTAIAVVPLRSGSGTRVKVLEAFARGIPVVSTTIGCEGLDVVDESHALLADTPSDMTEACVRLLTDPDLARSIAHNGYSLWSDRYQWHDIRDKIRNLALDAVSL